MQKFELTGLLSKELAYMRLDKLNGSIFDYTQWNEDNEYGYEDFN